MITEPQINKQKLINDLNFKYDFFVANLVFNPKGWASWSYFVESNGTNSSSNKAKFFLKIYKDNNFSMGSFDFTYQLFKECGINNIVHPVKTIEGDLVFEVEGHKAVLFNYIEGNNIKGSDLDQKQYEIIGELLGKVHNSINIIGPYQNKEDFLNPFQVSVEQFYDQLAEIQAPNHIAAELKELFISYKDIFMKELQIVTDLGLVLQQNQIETVNCHGEPVGDNIMIDNSGEIYLIDWDEPLVAPKEKDLLFFSNHYDDVLNGYKRVFPNAVINKEIENFYLHLWNAQEIEDFGSILLNKDASEKECTSYLKEFKNFLNYSGLKLT